MSGIVQRNETATPLLIARNGLRADVAKWQQTQREAAERYAEKQREKSFVQTKIAAKNARYRRNRKARLEEAAAVQPKQRSGSKRPGLGDFSDGTRKIIAARSGGRCEVGLDGCLEVATQVHHRKLRRHKDHRVVNGLHVCAACHQAIHANPRASAKAGLIVRATPDSALVPVRLRFGLFLLTDDGGTERYSTAVTS